MRFERDPKTAYAPLNMGPIIPLIRFVNCLPRPGEKFGTNVSLTIAGRVERGYITLLDGAGGITFNGRVIRQKDVDVLET